MNERWCFGQDMLDADLRTMSLRIKIDGGNSVEDLRRALKVVKHSPGRRKVR
jgi:hypothetical protein